MRRIAIVLHEATRTGAPKVGGLIGGALLPDWDVQLVLMKDGPLRPWLEQRIGADRVHVAEEGAFSHHNPFAHRLDRARMVLESLDADLVYCNSLATSCFAAAARGLDQKIVLHLHEKPQEMLQLFSLDVAKLDILQMCDGIVFAAPELEAEALRVFGHLPGARHHFGIALDLSEVQRLATSTDIVARNHAGVAFTPAERLIVGMCGHASARKGADLFLSCAEAMPAADFLWIGAWEAADAPENIAFPDYQRLQLDNFYLSGPTSNPYALMRDLDVFFLSSREDPNPLVIGEASALGATILAFSAATAVTDSLGRHAILCYGDTNVEDSLRVLKAMTPEAMRSPEMRRFAQGYAAGLDVGGKATRLAAFLEGLPEGQGDPSALEPIHV